MTAPRHFDIKHRYTNAVLYASGGESLRHVVEQAVAAGAYLDGANLARANLAGANLAGAYLARAYLDGANLDGATLDGAYLDGANLDGANLNGAKLDGANLAGNCKLIGNRPILQVGPIGSRCAYLISFITDAGVMVRAGCWYGSLAEFGPRVVEEHGNSVHGREYAAAIALIEAHASLWTPAGEVAREAA